MRWIKWILGMFVVAAALTMGLVASVHPSQAGGAINVTTTDDEYNSDGDCSLEEAVEAANMDSAVDACPAGSGADVINVPAGTYGVTSQFDIISDVTLVGEGASTTVIDGGQSTRVFRMGSKDPIEVNMSGLTIQNGSAGFGAGIRTFFDVTLHLDMVAVHGNVADCDGGGIESRGTLSITNSAVTDNQSLCTDSGGGIASYDQMALSNVTLSGNSADNGGAIRNDGTATLTNVTIYDNEAEIDTGGILNNGEMEMTNTIVGGSVNGNCGGDGTFVSGGHNVEDEDTCGFGGAGDQPNTEPVLGPLADNGGPTQTHALLAGSPAIDSGDDAACPDTDQRGVARPQDGDLDGSAVCDIGAFELQVEAPPTPTPTAPAGEANVTVSVSDDTPEVGDTIDISVTVTDDQGSPVSGVSCTFSILEQPGDDAALASETATTGEDGVATVGLEVGSTPGTVQVLADCGAYGSDVLDVVVAPAGLPATGAGGDGGSGRNALVVAFVALAAGLAGCASLGAALRSRARR